jgi:hypothetical protein
MKPLINEVLIDICRKQWQLYKECYVGIFQVRSLTSADVGTLWQTLTEDWLKGTTSHQIGALNCRLTLNEFVNWLACVSENLSGIV